MDKQYWLLGLAVSGNLTWTRTGGLKSTETRWNRCWYQQVVGEKMHTLPFFVPSSLTSIAANCLYVWYWEQIWKSDLLDNFKDVSKVMSNDLLRHAAEGSKHKSANWALGKIINGQVAAAHALQPYVCFLELFFLNLSFVKYRSSYI